VTVFNEAEQAANDAADVAEQTASGMLRKAVIKLIDDAAKQAIAQIQMLDDETEDAELVQQYGFTSSPPEDSEAIVILLGGVPENQTVIGTSKRDKRPKVGSGEVKIWVADGVLIHLTSSEIRLGDGATKGVNREGDGTTIDASTDAAFIAPVTGWVALVSAFINGIAPGTIPTVPTAVAGKTDAGSGTVKAVD